MDEGLTPKNPRKYSEIFVECCPFYLSIGMSSEEYWEGDPSLPQYFLKAYKMRQEQLNHEAWLHGLYVYDAMISAMTHLSDKKSDHKDYATKPYSFEKSNEEELQEKELAEAQAEVWMKSWVSATQRQFN